MSYKNSPQVVRAGTPGATDDAANGFINGAVWIDSSVSPRVAYTCVDSTTGAAVWRPQGGGGGGGGTPASTVVSSTTFGQASAVGTSTDYARADHVHGTPPSPVTADLNNAWFGDGAEGNVVVSGLFTAPGREYHPNNLTITGTGTFKPDGCRVFVKDTLTIDAGGSFNDDGGNGTASVTPPSGRTVQANYLGALFGGGGGGRNTTSTGTIGGASNTASLNAAGLGPRGGTGGASGVGQAGGAFGTLSTTAVAKWSGSWVTGRPPGTLQFSGGSGGGGGGASVAVGAVMSGAGGAGGGIVWLAAKTIVNNGRISANGGNGGNASGIGDGGGGGGGGGGLVAVLTKTPLSGLGVVTANGGTGGTGSGASGQPGVNGTAGVATLVGLI